MFWIFNVLFIDKSHNFASNKQIKTRGYGNFKRKREELQERRQDYPLYHKIHIGFVGGARHLRARIFHSYESLLK